MQNQNSQLQVLENDKKEKDEAVKQLKDQEKEISAQIKNAKKNGLPLTELLKLLSAVHAKRLNVWQKLHVRKN